MSPRVTKRTIMDPDFDQCTLFFRVVQSEQLSDKLHRPSPNVKIYTFLVH